MQPANVRGVKKRQRRDAGRPRGGPIIDAVLGQTLAELATHGLEHFSVERVARRAEVNKTSIYRRWPTRDRLVAAALEGILLDAAAHLPDTGSVRGDLLGILTPIARLLGSPVGRAVARAAVSDQSASSVRALAARQLGHAADRMGQLIARARKRGEWRAGADGRQVVFMLVGALLHRALLEQRPMGAKWLEGLVAIAVEGVRRRP